MAKYLEVGVGDVTEKVASENVERDKMSQHLTSDSKRNMYLSRKLRWRPAELHVYGVTCPHHVYGWI